MENFPGFREDEGCLLEEAGDLFLEDIWFCERGPLNKDSECVDFIFFFTGNGSGQLVLEFVEVGDSESVRREGLFISWMRSFTEVVMLKLSQMLSRLSRPARIRLKSRG
jgi:hypothetical protein